MLLGPRRRCCSCKCLTAARPACSYEDEEHPETCQAFERTAELFLGDSGNVEEITD